MPVALPPAGSYPASIDGRSVALEIDADLTVRIRPVVSVGSAAPIQVSLR
jgi:hypothetical protein